MFRATTIPRALSGLSVAPRTTVRNLAQMSLVGRITAPEQLATRNGETFYKFAVVDRHRTASGEFESHFYNVSCFDQTRLEYLAGLNKGDLLHVVADVTPRTYEVEGKKVNAYNLTARSLNVIFRSKFTDGQEGRQESNEGQETNDGRSY